MRRNNLARNLERFEAQKKIRLETDKRWKEGMALLESMMAKQDVWLTQAEADRIAELNPDPNSPVTYYDRELTFWEKYRGAIYFGAAIGLVITIAKWTYILVNNGAMS